jgi:hypothetical protein
MIQVEVFWSVTPRNVVVGYRRFRCSCCLHLQGTRISVTSVSYHKTAQCHNKEDLLTYHFVMCCHSKLHSLFMAALCLKECPCGRDWLLPRQHGGVGAGMQGCSSRFNDARMLGRRILCGGLLQGAHRSV